MEIAHGFFKDRRSLNLKKLRGGGHQKQFAEYVNVPSSIGTLLSKKMATLHELDTIYGVKDVYDMLEIVIIDSYNNAIANQE